MSLKDKLYSNVRSIVSKAGDLLFPPVCIVCRRYSEKGICRDCLKLVTRKDRESETSTGLFEYGRLYYYARYTGVIKEVVADYKFRSRMWIGKRLGSILYDYYRDCFDQYDCLVYVPVSRPSFKKRGFDQCFEIAAEISKESGVPLVNAFESLSGKGRQSKLKRGLRKDNVTGRFKIKDELLEKNGLSVCGSSVLLIDDILTTGSTLRECAELLINCCGCRKVDAMVFATGRTDAG